MQSTRPFWHERGCKAQTQCLADRERVKACSSEQHVDDARRCASPSHTTSQPFALMATGALPPLRVPGHPEALLGAAAHKRPRPALPLPAPAFPTAWPASSAMPPRAGLAALRGAPHCYSWHGVILPASSEAHKNTRSLSLSPVASSEKMVLPAAFWERLLPRMVWYVQGWRVSMN